MENLLDKSRVSEETTSFNSVEIQSRISLLDKRLVVWTLLENY
jgi:hypothetical protein